MRVVGTPARALLAAAVLGGSVVWVSGLFGGGSPAGAFLPSTSAAAVRSTSFASLGEPTAVAVLPDRDLLVTDLGTAGVRRFSPDGRLLARYFDGGLQYPTGLAVAEDGRVWVADLWARTLYLADLATSRLEEVARESAGYAAPGGLAYRDGRLYVADLERHQILILDARDGRLLRALGRGPGSEPGQLSYPNGMWPSASGEVFVADTNNQRIVVFDARGVALRIFHPPGLFAPRGITQDRSGRLHVADSIANEVVVLDARSGDVLGRYGSQDELLAPMGIAFSVGDRRAYVADRGNGRVVAWELGE